MSDHEARKNQPLADKMRPTTLDEVVGQSHLLGKASFIRQVLEGGKALPSLILWGPPGVGKTTLARIIAQTSGYRFVELSAVTSGKADVKREVEAARDFGRLGQQTILFVDEIHRFNKAQQDFLLPFVEDGTLTFIGATTENPSFEVISPLLSRTKVLTLVLLSPDELSQLIDRAIKGMTGKTIQPQAKQLLVELSAGDARIALNGLETAATIAKRSITKKIIESAMQQVALAYDKTGEQHYNTISAFIKSMRGSHVDASLFYLHRMLESGEDPLFIARRLIIFASEDVGMASPHALTLAVAAFQALERVGLPEGKYMLTHVTIALAGSPKSRSVADAMYASSKSVKENPAAQVPMHLRNAVTGLMKELGYQDGYEWKADFKHSQGFMPIGLENETFYKKESTDR